MIKFDIIDAPKEVEKGLREIATHKLRFGSSEKIPLNLKGFMEFFIKKDSSLYCHGSDIEILRNDKVHQEDQSLRKNDLIKVGPYLIQIIDFGYNSSDTSVTQLVQSLIDQDKEDQLLKNFINEVSPFL